MFCSKCGEKLPDGSKFCGKCGQPVRPISGNPGAQAEKAQSAQVQKEQNAQIQKEQNAQIQKEQNAQIQKEQNAQIQREQSTQVQKAHSMQNQIVSEMQPQKVNPDERQGKRRTSKPVAVPVLAALAVVAIVAVAVICVVLFRGAGKNTVDSADSASGADAGGEDTGTAENGGGILDEVKELFEDEENIIYLPSGYTHLNGDETETGAGRYVYNVDGFVVEGYFYQDEELAATEVIEYNAEGDKVCYSIVRSSHTKQEMSYEYDDSGRAVQITQITYTMNDGEFIESGTVVTNYSYDSSGIVSECTETTNGVTLDYKMEFNSDGTVKAREKDDGEHVTRYEYTYENGYVQSVELAVTGENGYIVHQIMVYDETGTSIVNCGNLLKIWNYVDEELSYTLSYEYISATVTSEGIVLSDEFASQEKVQSKTTKYWQKKISDEYFYNTEGQLIQEIDHNDGIDFKYTNYEYDEQGRLISEKCYSDETDELLSWYDDYQYDDNGNVISKTWYTSGNGAEKPNEVYTYEYDEKGLLLNYALVQTGNLGTASYYYEYEYDSYGNMTGEHCYQISSAYNMEPSYIKENGVHFSYYEYENEYDSENRLVTSYQWCRISDDKEVTSETYQCKKIYEYDSDGDLIRESWYNSNDNCYCSYDYEYTYK